MNKRSRVGIMVFLVLLGMMLGGVLPSSAVALHAVSSSVRTAVSGVVYDGGVEGGDSHGYPLYASLTFTAPGISQTVYCDPFEGTYQVELEPGKTYTVTVSALVSGYQVISTDLVVSGSGSQTRDFTLYVKEALCQAPGYSGGAFFEDFESGELPAGWSNVDDAGNGEVWEFLFDPPNENETPGEGGFAILDSFNYGGLFGHQDAGLRTPVMNFSNASNVTLDFDMDFVSWYATAAVRVSGDNGNTWTTRASWVNDVRKAHISLDISSQAAGKAQVIVEFRYTGDPDEPWGDWWQVDNVSIQAGDCSRVSGGVVAGFVRDANTGDPLVGADVVSTGVATETFALEGDPENVGLFWAFQPTTTNPQSFDYTASLEDYTSDTQAVSVVGGVVNRQDFTLGTGYLVFDPGGFEVTMNMGDAPLDQTLTISNSGALPVDFNLELVNKPFPYTPAYAIGYPGENLVYISDTSKPDSWQILGSVVDEVEDRAFYAGDFVGGDFSTLFVIDSYTDTLFALDTAAAVFTEIGVAAAYGNWTGLTGTPEGVLYGISSDCNTITNLFTINPGTAAVTSLGELDGIRCGMDLAYNTDVGLIYMVDTYTDRLFRVHPGTLAVTDVGPLGIHTDYAQSMDYEEHSGLLYWAAYNLTEDRGELRVIDMATGESELIGPFPGGEQVTVLAFATSDSREWLSLNPQGGILQPGNSVNVTLTVDPSVLDHPGIYQAEVITLHDTVYEVAHIPVKLNLQGPPTIISPDQTTFTVGVKGEFTIQTSGFPMPMIEINQDLPNGLELIDQGDGTASLFGTPGEGSGGEYSLTVTASNDIPPDAEQVFTLTINEAPSITSQETISFTVGERREFNITTQGFPTPNIEVDQDLPNGIELMDQGDGTASITGTPMKGTGGEYALTITASNSVEPDTFQDLTLIVNEAPSITSQETITFNVGEQREFIITTEGFPTPRIEVDQDLPNGIELMDQGDGTAVLSGTPSVGQEGETYEFTITASNGIGPDAVQEFVLYISEKLDVSFKIFLPLINR